MRKLEDCGSGLTAGYRALHVLTALLLTLGTVGSCTKTTKDKQRAPTSSNLTADRTSRSRPGPRRSSTPKEPPLSLSLSWQNGVPSYMLISPGEVVNVPDWDLVYRTDVPLNLRYAGRRIYVHRDVLALDLRRGRRKWITKNLQQHAATLRTLKLHVAMLKQAWLVTLLKGLPQPLMLMLSSNGALKPGVGLTLLKPIADKIYGLRLGKALSTPGALAQLPHLAKLKYFTPSTVPTGRAPCFSKLPGLWQLALPKGNVKPASLEFLRGLKRLRILEMSGVRVQPAATAHIRSLVKLRQLVVDAKVARRVLSALTELRFLSLTGASGKDLAHLSTLNKLEGLDLAQSDALGARDLAVLAKLRKLRWLDLRNAEVTDAGLVHLKPLRRLEALSLSDNAITALDDGLVKSLAGLRLLHLSKTKITSSTVARLSRLTRLRVLVLEQNHEVKKGALELGKLRALRHLDVSGTQLNGRPVSLAPLTRLRHLDAGYSGISFPPGDLAKLTKLRYLDLRETAIKAVPAKPLGRLKRLHLLRLGGMSISESLLPLKSLSRLELLDLNGCPTRGCTTDPILLPRLRRLKTLLLNGRRAVHGQTFTNLRRAPLTKLDLQGVQLRPEFWAPLGAIRALRWLNLNSTSLNDQAMSSVGKLKNLRYLDIRDSKVTDDSIYDFASLRRLKRLHHAGDIGCPFSKKAVAQLRKMLPKARIDDWVDDPD